MMNRRLSISGKIRFGGIEVNLPSNLEEMSEQELMEEHARLLEVVKAMKEEIKRRKARPEC